MQEELRFSLLLIGSIFILAILAHGIWNIRKNKQSIAMQRQEPPEWEDDEEYEDDNDFHDDNQVDETEKDPIAVDDDDEIDPIEQEFDEIGVGKVRVVSKNEVPPSSDKASSEPVEETVDAPEVEQLSDSQSEEDKSSGAAKKEESADKEESKLYGAVVSNPKPHIQTSRSSLTTGSENTVVDDIPEPPEFLLKTEPTVSQLDEARAQAPDFELNSGEINAPAVVEQSQESEKEKPKSPLTKRKSKPSRRKRKEPSFGDKEQMNIDFEESPQIDDASEKTAPAVEQEVLSLNIRVPQDRPIEGAALLPMLLTLGFKFGEQDIFHRHVNVNGKGPILFSLANMFKPGIFDIDNFETFSTNGVTLFMLLPIEGDPHQVFNMMHNAARKLADEFSGQVLDGRRSVLTKQGLQQYVEKIREFERQRMIARH